MNTQARSARRAADTDRHAAASDPYDDRHRQTKALAQYERQRVAWDRMQEHLLSSTAAPSTHARRGSAGGVAATLNMARATPAARAKRDGTTIVEVATAASANTYGSHAWEGLLRRTSETEARRLVPIGRTSAPCPLYCEARAANTLPDDHLAFARVVAEEDGLAAVGELRNANGTWNASDKFMRDRTVAQARVKDGLAGGTNTAALHDLFTDDATSPAMNSVLHADAMDSLSPASYYEAQLRRFAPYVQQRLGHLLQPRTFLQVEGQPAPYATEEDASYLRAAAADRPNSAPPVEFFPPPLPPPPQTQYWSSSALTSRVTSRNGFTGGGGGGGGGVSTRSMASPTRRHEQRLGEVSARGADRRANHESVNGGVEEAEERGNTTRAMLDGSTDTAQPHFADLSTVDGERAHTQRTQPPSPLHPMCVQDGWPSHGADNNEDSMAPLQRDGPAMELSTRALFFRTHPQELQQGTATLRNTGTTTIYYSWTVVDAAQEHLREAYEATQEFHSEDGGSEASITSGELPSKERLGHAQRRTPAAVPFTTLSLTHHLAAHQRAARDGFFFLSSPLNGVVLPGQATVFPFSVRASREGLFQNTYELLTVPPAPERIFVRLRALVRRGGPSLQWLSRPVADALAAKVAVDSQRRLVQKLGSNTIAIEAAELRERLAAVDGAAALARQAEQERRVEQRAAWQRANRLTFDHLPYCPAVYDKLEKLSTVVRETFVRLSAAGDTSEERAKAMAVLPAHEKAADIVGAGTNPLDGVGVQDAVTPQRPQRTVVPSSTAASTLAPAGTAGVSPLPQNPQALQRKQSRQASPTAPCPETIRWDGALLPLLYQIMSIRDNAVRQVFLEAMQVLLRAARAARYVPDAPHSATSNSNSNNLKSVNERSTMTNASPIESHIGIDVDNEEEEEEAEDAPLPVLLSRAAAALAESVMARQRPLVEKQCEDSLLLPARPAAALALTASLSNENTTMTNAAAGGATKGRAPSAAHSGAGTAGKKSMAASKSGRGAAASIADSKESKGVTAAGGITGAAEVAAVTPAQRLLLSNISTAELQGFSVTQASAEMMTLLRAAEEDVMRARMEDELAEAKAAFTTLHTALFREVVDAACDRGPLATCTTERLAELREVQQGPLLAVDVSVDPLVAPPAGKPGKRK